MKDLLSDDEKRECKKEKIDFLIIESVKAEWMEALKIFISQLDGKYQIVDSSSLEERIVYKPFLFYSHFNTSSTAAMDHHYNLYFTTPNRIVNFDYCPTIESKLGVLAHEYIGHVIDCDEFYDSRFDALSNECSEYIAPEQRANLITFAVYPVESYEYVKNRVVAHFKKNLFSSPSEASKIPKKLFAIELLGKMGMPRRDEVLSYFRLLQDEGFQMQDYLRDSPTYILAGLATPRNLNEESRYGIKRREDNDSAKRHLASYLEYSLGADELQEKLKKLNFKTSLDQESDREVRDYNPASSFILPKALRELALNRLAEARNRFAAEFEEISQKRVENEMREGKKKDFYFDDLLKAIDLCLERIKSL